MKSWVKETIGSICDKGGGLVKTGPFGSQLHQSDYQEEGTPVVMPTDIRNGRIDTQKIARVSQNHVDRLKHHKLSIGDIVYGRRGDIGRQALIKKENEGWLCGTGCLRITLAESSVIPLFLHLYLQMSAVINWIQNQAIGATMPNLNTKILRNIPINYPPLLIQKKIAAILSAYDDLIENNNRRIAILEKMAGEIYREWFVRFRFPGHENVKVVKSVPEGWNVKKLTDFIEFQKGIEPGSDNYLEYKEDESVQFLRVGDLNKRDSKIFIKKYISQNIRCNYEDLLMSFDGTVGIVKYGLSGCYSSGIRKIIFKDNILPKWYVYLLLKSETIQSVIFQHATGSTILHASSAINHLKFIFSSKNLINDFNSMVEPIFENILKLQRMIEFQSKSRDILLSRLITGKLDLDNLDISFTPSMVKEEFNV